MSASYDTSKRQANTTSTATQNNLAASEQSQLQAQVVTGNKNTTLGNDATEIRGNNSGTLLQSGATQTNVGGNVTVNSTSLDPETIAGAFGLTTDVVNQMAALNAANNVQNVNLAEYTTNQLATVADNSNLRNAELADNANSRVSQVALDAQTGAYNLSGLAINQLADLASQTVGAVTTSSGAAAQQAADLAAQAAKMAADNNVALSEAFQNFGNDLTATKTEALTGGQADNNKTLIYAIGAVAAVLALSLFTGKSK